MGAKLRVLSALCALIAAVIVVWQTNPADPQAPGNVELRSTAAPLSDVSTTIKWPVVDTVDPRPFDPCDDIPIDVIQRIGLAFTPPTHEDGLRCHYDAGNYQMAARCTRARHQRASRGAVLDHEADRLERPLVDHLRYRVQDQLRRHPADAVLLAEVRR
jgi:hypothetical protein